MNKGANQPTIVIEDSVPNSEHGIGPYHYEDINEIKKYLDRRYVSPVYAIWRIFEFEIMQCYSSVELLQYHLSRE